MNDEEAKKASDREIDCHDIAMRYHGIATEMSGLAWKSHTYSWFVCTERRGENKSALAAICISREYAEDVAWGIWCRMDDIARKSYSVFICRNGWDGDSSNLQFAPPVWQDGHYIGNVTG